ncbi:hypothetical protein DNTS_001736 [Danionella cerebrum]|uniref:Uncharacterized protein n=1 Tax=Danionella cerebrum TaxID=2873325 RepID=A0A553RP90_9TELE|nr:hypothetical protein DNTS_001736 [Danionella translucida]
MRVSLAGSCVITSRAGHLELMRDEDERLSSRIRLSPGSEPTALARALSLKDVWRAGDPSAGYALEFEDESMALSSAPISSSSAGFELFDVNCDSSKARDPPKDRRGGAARHLLSALPGSRALHRGPMLLSCPLALLLVMGCVQSLKCKPRSVREGVAVLELRASIDPEPTSIDESSRVVLRYRTPHFRASARVLLPPLRSPESWTVGWIQACERMRFHNQYGDQGV